MQRSDRARIIPVVGLLAAQLFLPPARAQEPSPAKEQALIGILQSDAEPAKKAITCKELALHGSAEAVPALAALLGDKQLASWARIALEAIPDPAVDVALRSAVAKLEGRLLVGTINSIGVRRDGDAVPVLVGKLSDAHAHVASAAAAALGRIGTDPAAEALTSRLASAPDAVRTAMAEGCILCAEQRLNDGRFSEALAIYRAVRDAAVSKQKTREALRGCILSMRSEGLPLLAEQLRSEDKALFGLGLQLAREISEPGVARVLAAELKNADPNRKAYILLALAERGDAEALPLALDLAGEGPMTTRLMAVDILDKLGDPSAAKVLLKLAAEDDAELSSAAKKVLFRLPGEETDAAIAASLQDADPDLRCLAIDLLAQRRMPGMVPHLVKRTRDDDENVRIAALKALSSLADIDQVETLLDVLVKSKTPAEIRAAENAVSTLCLRSSRMESGSVVILKALYGDLPEGKTADVTGKVAKMVKSGSLDIVASNTFFGDPADGIAKSLVIEYKVGGKVLSKQVAENGTLTLSVRMVPPACTDSVLAALTDAPTQPKLALLRILGSFGGSDALKAIRQALNDPSSEIREAAVRTLFDWPDAEALPDLVKLAKTAPQASFKILALQGAIRLIQLQELPADQKVPQIKALQPLAQRDQEIKLVLAALGTLPTVEALAMAAPYLDQPAFREEAAVAVVAIAERLTPPRPEAVTAAVLKVTKMTSNKQTGKRADVLLNK